MSREVWATYSVKDHLDRRALAADVMLYDRLVFRVLFRIPTVALCGLIVALEGSCRRSARQLLGGLLVQASNRRQGPSASAVHR